MEKRSLSQKVWIRYERGLRVVGSIRKSPLTGGAEAHDGTADGADDAETRKDVSDGKRKIRGYRGGARRSS